MQSTVSMAETDILVGRDVGGLECGSNNIMGDVKVHNCVYTCFYAPIGEGHIPGDWNLH